MKSDKVEVERKTMPAWIKSITGRNVVGITAVAGNVDSGGDRILAGAFTKTLKENARRFRHLWQHGADGWDYGVTPPIAAIKRIEEVGRAQLPQAITDEFPEATGGLEVEREYLRTPRGDEVLACYEAGIQLEMSIGFNAVKVVYVGDDDNNRQTPGHWRDLLEIRLFDTSDVNWGMNAATVGSKSFERRLALLVERMKSLRVEEFRAESAPADLLDEFRALCAEFSVVNPQAEEPSRAELSDGKISLTQSLKQLREMELALVS